MTESLDQQVHRLLGLCWHEFEPDTPVVDTGNSCIKCKEIVLIETGLIRPDECGSFSVTPNGGPGYITSLDAAWNCIEHVKELTFSQRLLFKDCIRQRCLWEKVSGQIIELDWNEVLFRVDSLVICKAFVEAMGEEPVE